MEELTYKELAELLVASGDLTVQEAEELMGGDIDDSDDSWKSDEHLMKTGQNPAAIHAQQEMEELGRSRMSAITHSLFADLDRNLLENIDKAVAGAEKPGHKYATRHLSTGGNWVYSGGPASTASGATQRANNKGGGSTAPVREKSTQTDSHINYRAKVGNKDYTIKARNPRQHGLLAKTKQRLRGKATLSS